MAMKNQNRKEMPGFAIEDILGLFPRLLIVEKCIVIRHLDVDGPSAYVPRHMFSKRSTWFHNDRLGMAVSSSSRSFHPYLMEISLLTSHPIL